MKNISLADAEDYNDVFVASIASVAGVEESTVEVTGFTVAEARRRRLLDDEVALTVDYKISAAVGLEEAIAQTMSEVSPAEMTEARRLSLLDGPLSFVSEIIQPE